MTDRSSLRHRLLRLAAPRLTHHFLSLIKATSEVVTSGTEAADAMKAKGDSFIFAFWHARQAAMILLYRNWGISALISRSTDGDLIAEVVRLSGNTSARGSSSRGGAAALKELVTAGKGGVTLAVTPDGPRGPALAVQPGVLFLAQQLGLPIVPAAIGLKKKWEARSWDRFQVPLPFNRIALVHGPALRVGESDDLEAKAAELKAALDAVAQQADYLANA